MQYVPFASDIEIPFYAALASHKINHDKLDDSARKVLGLVPAGFYRAEGMIKNVNTIEEFRQLCTERTAFLQQAGRTIWDAINDSTIYSCPSLLASFVILSYADLKKYKFHYWFAFPALQLDPSWTPDDEDLKGKALSGLETSALVDAVQTWRYGVDTRQHGFFIAKKMRGLTRTHSRDDEEEEEHRPITPKTPTEKLGYSWAIASLSAYDNDFFKDTEEEDRFVCFADPSNYPQAPGWTLRNLLVLVRQLWGLKKAQVLCYRDVQSRRDGGRSIVYSVKVPTQDTQVDRAGSKELPKVVGWERNGGKLIGRMANLTEYMDPTKLADQSVDLNLKLMKWRISPNLDLEKVKGTKCLLLGAGTLGSYVARNLMGWGVRKITFVDNGSVSFSNPVRQPLFNFKDCLDGGAKKAYQASEALREIYPGVDSVGHVMSVPMAGHPVTDTSKTKREFEQLAALIEAHDVIFLLMDTRESRWLPTVMGKAAGKIVMNAALGFDSFVVMRHGARLEGDRTKELGCYFCNDVVAPADSMKDQTLDQQCTVTRPGVAAIASALLVELLISVLQHPQGAAAPASVSPSEDRGDHPLGLIPHQIRGFLSNFQNISILGKSYDCCSACSDRILDAYRKDGWEFVEKALNEKGYVEELSGLAEVQKAAEAAASEIDWDEGGEDDDEGEGEII
ncbi:putative e1-like protein-activating enzyme gsa7p apg7p [Phaeomoniella chlamydospora]|uniref:Ubiquitin-like modifier-activating enzyme ATG7 n=1 Tax=Phaeomoniella chlamydospora TaxID=158046 RepID=A0A0G2GXE7_PHACM|nr:putative e1-like protein-activating enzyme gsa7p apg7p [Phaeomoniella chlamydospora]